MKKLIFLFFCISTYHHSISMELAQPSHLTFPLEIKKQIIRDYFSTAHTTLKPFFPCKSIVISVFREISGKKDVLLYSKNIGLIDTEFYACINDKDIIRIFIKNVSLHRPSLQNCFYYIKMPGVENYIKQCRTLTRLIEAATSITHPAPEAITKNNNQITQLVSDGADADCRLYDMNTYLHLTTKHNCYEYTELLLELGADPNVYTCRDKAPFKNAVGNINIEMVKLLLTYGARNGGYYLQDAVTIGNVAMIELLLTCPDLSVSDLTGGRLAALQKKDLKTHALITVTINRMIHELVLSKP